MALATVSRDVERLWFSEITFARILRGFFGVSVWITAMAIVAGQTARFMNVVVEKFRGRAESRVIELAVAFDTGTLLLC